MKKAVLISDSFKGTMSSSEICGIMEECIKNHYPDCVTLSIPVADGGEGSVDAFLAAVGGQKIFTTVSGPFFEPMRAYYGLIDSGDTAIIEMSACAGLPLVENRKNPLLTTTFGVGELIKDAASKGVKQIIIGLGGSSTNDGGCGAAAAVGVKFRNYDGNEFVPTGGTLTDIESIDISNMDPSLSEITFITMCDIDNPMYGKNGAAYIFAPQKGADSEMVEALDYGLIHLSNVIEISLGKRVYDTPGSGAAGAMGAGMLAFFNSTLQMGIETVLDTVQFDDIIKNADFVFTGEGKLDSQSLRGKVVIGVARRAKKCGIPVIAIVGGADYDIDQAYREGVTAVFTINRLPIPLSESGIHSRGNLAFVMTNIMKLLKSAD